jgi:hypothetical protein
MPEGSSSAAPVTRPGPSRCSSVGADFVGASALSFLAGRCFRADLPELRIQIFKNPSLKNPDLKRVHGRKVPAQPASCGTITDIVEPAPRPVAGFSFAPVQLRSKRTAHWWADAFSGTREVFIPFER